MFFDRANVEVFGAVIVPAGVLKTELSTQDLTELIDVQD